LKKIIFSFIIFVILSLIAILVVGKILAMPAHRTISTPTTDFNAEKVSITRRNQPPIAGWFLKNELSQPGILLLHKLRSSRLGMIDRAKFLHKSGYNVLLIDFQGHGETFGKHITFGYLESFDAHSAFNYLKNRLVNQPIGVIGVSLGGVAALIGKEPIPAEAIILESVFSTIDQAVKNRLVMRFGTYGQYFSPLLTWQIDSLLGFPAKTISPIDGISKVKSAVFIMSGSEDRRALLQETHSLYENANQPKMLWIVEGATHQNLHQYSTQAYEEKVLRFFDQHLN